MQLLIVDCVPCAEPSLGPVHLDRDADGGEKAHHPRVPARKPAPAAMPVPSQFPGWLPRVLEILAALVWALALALHAS